MGAYGRARFASGGEARNKNIKISGGLVTLSQCSLISLGGVGLNPQINAPPLTLISGILHPSFSMKFHEEDMDEQAAITAIALTDPSPRGSRGWGE